MLAAGFVFTSFALTLPGLPEQGHRRGRPWCLLWLLNFQGPVRIWQGEEGPPECGGTRFEIPANAGKALNATYALNHSHIKMTKLKKKRQAKPS